MIPLRWLVTGALALVVFVVGYTLANQFPPPTIRVTPPLTEAQQTRTPTPQERQAQVVTLTNETEGEPVVFLPLPTTSTTPAPHSSATTEPHATTTIPIKPSATEEASGSPTTLPTPTAEGTIPVPPSDTPRIMRFELDTSSVRWDGTVTATWETTGFEMVTLTIDRQEDSIGFLLPSPYTFVEDLPTSGSRTFRISDIFAGTCAVPSLNWHLQANNYANSTFQSADAEVTVDLADYPIALDSFTMSPNPVAANGTTTITYDGRGGARLQIFGDTNINADWPDVAKYWAELVLEGEDGSYSYQVPGRHTTSTAYSVIYGQPDGPTVCNTYTLEMTCPYTYWIDEPQEQTEESCPTSDKVTVPASYQRFEHGVMLWDSGLKMIYVLYDDGTNAAYPDYWNGQPIVYPIGAAYPPPGTIAPTQGFGYVWANYSELPSRLGWATAPEQPYTMTRQRVKNGYDSFYGGYNILGPLYATLPDGKIVRARLGSYNGLAGWEILP